MSSAARRLKRSKHSRPQLIHICPARRKFPCDCDEVFDDRAQLLEHARECPSVVGDIPERERRVSRAEQVRDRLQTKPALFFVALATMESAVSREEMTDELMGNTWAMVLGWYGLRLEDYDRVA